MKKENNVKKMLRERTKFNNLLMGSDPSFVKIPEDTFENAELIIIPKDDSKENFTYAFKTFCGNSSLNSNDILPYLLNIEPVTKDNSKFDELDGILKADPVTFKDSDGNEEKIDLGSGFLSTENHYSLNFPESISDVSLSLVWFRQIKSGSNEYVSANITIEGNESYTQHCKGPEANSANNTLSDPIPLNSDKDTVIHIELTTSEKNKTDLSSEYIITVKKHPDIQKQKVSFYSEMQGIKLSVKNSNGKNVAIQDDKTCLLKDGEYTYIATCSGYRSLSGSFTVDTSLEGDQVVEIPALEGPRKVTFTSSTAGLKVTVKDAKNKQVSPEDGAYYLIGGDSYTYYAAADGYLTVKDTFTVGDDLDQVVEIPALTEAPDLGRGKTVSVSIVSDETRLMSAVSVPMNLTSEEMDLVSGKNYVEYNLGTYTALHALIYALDDDQGVDYTCRKGKLKVITDMAGTYSNGSWVCEVNGIPVAEPSLYPVRANDQILLYFNKGYEGMIHALFKDPIVEITEGESVTLTLYGHEIGEGSDESVLAGATIYVNQKEAGTTDASGSITLKDLTMAGSPYVVTAKKMNSAGQNVLTYNQCMISVQSKTENISGSQTVRFRLIGDSLHGDTGHESYQTWIATEEIPLASGTNTVYDIFMKAINCAGLIQDGGENGYIRMVQAPKSLGGMELREFDNGSSSGWMYTLNGIHPQLGVLEQTVKAGDVIVFHYVDNFHIEENTYTWLEALDENPEGIRPYVIQNVLNQITGLPVASKLALKDKSAVEEVRKAYNALTDQQKKQIDSADSSALKKLNDAESKIKELQKAADAQKTTTTTATKPATDPAVQKPSSTTTANTIPAASVVKVGTAVTVGNLNYKVTSVKAKKLTVTVTGMKNKKKTSVKIPATINISKKAYKVTAIGNNAFKANKKLKTVTIGANVNTIGKNTFINCKNLKKITVQTKVLKKVGAKSLKGIHKKAVIKVPAKKLKAYKKLFNKKGQAKTVKIAR